MSDPYVDTDVIIRLVSGDDPRKQAAARQLFHRVEQGELVLTAPVTVVFDAVFVLTSSRIYRLPRAYVRDMLTTLLRLPNFRVESRRSLLRALDLFVAFPHMGFGDAMIVATMEENQAQDLYSYDRGFNRVPGINRQEP